MRREAQRRQRELEKHRAATRRVREIRAALRAGVDPASFDRDAYAFVLRTAGSSLGQAVSLMLRDTAPKPAGLANAFTFDGTAEELEAHNEAVKRHAERETLSCPAMPKAPIVTTVTVARSRERRPSCGRVRGSRRGRTRCTRAGPSSDDPDPDEPEPERGHSDGRRSRR